MIREINIENLGVIASARLSLDKGLSVLTGETGAGKTMVLSSIAWLMGKKADPALVRYGSETGSVEGVFTVPDPVKIQVEEAGGFTEEDELIIVRQVPAQGRSRAIAGGRSVPAGLLGQIGEQLLKVHGQSDQLLLRTASEQLRILDEYGGQEHRKLIEAYMQAFQERSQLLKQWQEWQASEQQREQEIENLQFGLEKLAELEPVRGEEQEIQALIERLSNVEELSQAAETAYYALYGSDSQDVNNLLSEAIRALENAGGADPELLSYASSLQDSQYVIADVAEALRAYADALDDDPQELSRLQQRLASLRGAARNWASGVDEWIDWGEAARKRLEDLAGPENLSVRFEKELTLAEEKLTQLGIQLTSSRKKLAEDLTSLVNQELRNLAMANSGFMIAVEEEKDFTAKGKDRVSFGLKSTPQAALRALNQGASGGELSRIMLALEVSLSGNKTSFLAGEQAYVPTFIFDEVDSGVGGETALKIGERLARLAQNAQVIVVTHLPQVAAWAQHHYVVKREGNDTQVHQLKEKERVEEIARMLSGHADSESAKIHAQELLKNCNMG